LPLFSKCKSRTLALATVQYIGIRYMLAYDTLVTIATRMGFMTLDTRLLIDLAIMRIIEPSSKLRAITLMNRYFGINYSKRTVYRLLPKLCTHKTETEKIAVNWAKNGLLSELSLVFYDVTTLYFETFEADELRVPGFSKDNKSQQPQIVVGLLVTRMGFPLGYEVFKGNTFEGKTMLPVLDAFAKTHGVKTPTVVADAAMISKANIEELNSRGLSYIVGARLANTSPTIILQAATALAQKDGATMRLATDHGELVVGFSAKRYRKDKNEMEKQIAKANAFVKKGEPGKRAKFVKRKDDEDTYILDEALVAKTKKLLGMKGYYTNIPKETLSNQEIIERYHELWNIEATFRMAKSDLETRPIFHHKEDAIRAHMVICFVALAIGKYIEISTKSSIRNVVDHLWSVTDAQIVDSSTNEKFALRSSPSDDLRTILKMLG
jgi:transposase